MHGRQVRISDETNAAKATRVRRALTHADASSTWAFDFSDELLFPALPIESVHYSLVAADDAGFPQHVARTPVGATVAVQTSQPISGTVYIEVAQAL